MENRNRKREEMPSDQLPAVKRACTSTDQSNSGSSVNCAMETNSNLSNSVSGPEPGDTEADNTISQSNSANSDELAESEDDDNQDVQTHASYHYYRGRRSPVNQEKVRTISEILKAEAGLDSALAALTELCEVLSFNAEELTSSSADLLAPVLVSLVRDGSDPHLMLLSVRCITYLCDALPRSCGVLVRCDVVPVLCLRLMAIDYLDVAEQCLQALEKISKDHQVACLDAGVIMAALNYIDFFSTSIQRVALSTIANICKRLPSDRTSHFMEAVPILCNLLQYEDQKLVESVATCLIKIVDRVNHSSEMLDDLCKHGLIHRALNLIALNGKAPLSQSVYTGLIGVLCRLASGSIAAVRTLLELDISTTLKHILLSYDLARGMSFFVVGSEQCNQVHEFLKLLNELLPPLTRNSEDASLISDKEKILGDQPELLQQFGFNILPVLIQVVSSGVNLYICYCCLSVINKLVYFSRPEMLLDFFKNINISSILAGGLKRKDHHVLIFVLEIIENIMKKHPDVFLHSFIKEGVLYAIDALLIPVDCSESTFAMSASNQLPSGSNPASAKKNVVKCLCYAFDTDQSTSSSRSSICKLKEDLVHTLAKHIKESYFVTESPNSGMGQTESLQKLSHLCTLLIDNVHISMAKNICVQVEENLSQILGQIIMVLNAGEYMSTFEFIGSRIVKSLVTYLFNGHYRKENVDFHDYPNNSDIIQNRLEMFARLSLSSAGQNWEGMPIAILVNKLQIALSSLEDFSVILSHVSKPRNTYATIPFGRSTLIPCLKAHFAREEGEIGLCEYAADVVTIEPFSTLDEIEKFLLAKVSTQKAEHRAKLVNRSIYQPKEIPVQGPSDQSSRAEDQSIIGTHSLSSDLVVDQQDSEANLSTPIPERAILHEASLSLGQTPVMLRGDLHLPDLDTNPKSLDSDTATISTVALSSKHSKGGGPTPCANGDATPKLIFYYKGKQICRDSTLYQSILQQKLQEQHEVVSGPGFWNEIYEVTYRKAAEGEGTSQENLNGSQNSSARGNRDLFGQKIPFFCTMLGSELRCGMEISDPTYEILFLLKILEGINRFAFHLMSQGKKRAFSKGDKQELDNLVVIPPTVPPSEFVNVKLTEKLEQQLRDPLAVSTGSMPSWCNQLMFTCPYIFGFEAKCKYFRQVVLNSFQVQPRLWPQSVNNNSVSPTYRNSHTNGMRRKKFQVCRSRILDSAAKMMNQHARQKAILEVEFDEEVGSGLGPTLEFYTLVSQEFQKVGLSMWRGDHSSFTLEKGLMVEESGFLLAPSGLFPRPLSHTLNSMSESRLVEVLKKFVLLGRIVAKALQDGRVVDFLFSKAFYKLILGQELNIYDIQSIDPELGRTLLEFQALIERKQVSHSESELPFISGSCFRNTRIEDLSLDFSLPGYPDYMLYSGDEHKMVNCINLEEYVSSIVDATVNSGISRQVEAFKSGFDQVFPIKNLQIFTEGELERLLCGESDAWTTIELLENIKFDHGYTVSSPPTINLLEIIQDFNYDQKRAFLQFVTGAPRLPPGGLASLNPQLTVVRKHCSGSVDGDLPSVMTCANYLKLPPYSSKERMRERLLFAITEGQGSFHLS